MQIFCCLISCTTKNNNAENSFSKMSRASVKPKKNKPNKLQNIFKNTFQ